MIQNERIKVNVKRLWIKNFKSLKDFDLNLKKVNVIVGKNGSGKTNIIEAIKLLKMIIDYFKGIEVNPFLEWWGYNNAVWEKNERLNIAIGLEYEIEIHTKFLDEPKVNAMYEIVSTGIGGEFRILKESIRIPGIIELTRTTSSVEITLLRDINEDFCKKIAEQLMMSNSDKAPDLYHLPVYISYNYIEELYKPFKGKKEKDEFKRELASELKAICTIMLDLIKKKKLTLKTIYEEFLLEKAVNEYKLISSYDFDNYVEILYERIMDDIVVMLRNKIHELLKKESFRDEIPLIHEIFEYVSKSETKVISRILPIIIAHGLLDILKAELKQITNAIVGAHIIASKSIILKKLDYKHIREPIKLKKEDILAEDGSNLTAVLYSMRRGRIPERIDLAIKYAFGYNCSIHIEPTSDGRAYIKFFEKGIELDPPTIPDGLYKLIALEVALEYNAPIIAIDEFENSLHADVIRYFLDELRNSFSKAILTTHSPAVMDFADPCEIVILKKGDEGTKAYRFADPQKVHKLLKKEGIALSDYIIYKEMATDKEL